MDKKSTVLLFKKMNKNEDESTSLACHQHTTKLAYDEYLLSQLKRKVKMP